MVISIYQVNKVEARKGGGGSEYHAGNIVKYLGFEGFGCENSYLVQFEDKTEENVHGWNWQTNQDTGNIKVGSHWLQQFQSWTQN